MMLSMGTVQIIVYFKEYVSQQETIKIHKNGSHLPSDEACMQERLYDPPA